MEENTKEDSKEDGLATPRSVSRSGGRSVRWSDQLPTASAAAVPLPSRLRLSASPSHPLGPVDAAEEAVQVMTPALIATRQTHRNVGFRRGRIRACEPRAG